MVIGSPLECKLHLERNPARFGHHAWVHAPVNSSRGTAVSVLTDKTRSSTVKTCVSFGAASLDSCCCGLKQGMGIRSHLAMPAGACILLQARIRNQEKWKATGNPLEELLAT
eukprot:1142301-Pelagomonas_calceolata.AAC.4